MPPITHLDVRSMASKKGKEAMISCYVDVDGRRFVRQQDLEKELDRLARRARPRVNGNKSLQADLSRILSYVRDGFDRSQTRGLAFFACGAEGIFEVIHLPVSVSSQIVVSAAPVVGPIESAIEDHERHAAILVDRQRARLLVIDWAEVVEHSELADALPRGVDAGGARDWGDSRAHAEAAQVAQHLRHAAQAAFELFQQSGFERLVVGGNEESVAELERLLHPYLRERLAGRLSGVTITSPADEVRRAAIAVSVEAERHKEADLVARLREAVGAKRRAIVGLACTLEAVHEHRVEQLLVSDGYAEPGWRCPSCACLAQRGRTCSCGTEMVAVDDVVAEVIDDALSQRAKVQMCVGNADLDVLGRIGAFLRY